MQGLVKAAGRILDGTQRRVTQLTSLEEVHSYFAADMLITKLRALVEDMRALGAQVAADDIETRLKTSRDQALRGVRDPSDLVLDGGNSPRLGQHDFTSSLTGSRLCRQRLRPSAVPSIWQVACSMPHKKPIPPCPGLASPN